MKKNIIICEKVLFYSPKDEQAFFEWIKKIKCIDSYNIDGTIIYLYLKTSRLSYLGLSNLIGLLYRYNIEMTQLARFLTDENKAWFYDNKKAFWHKKVFSQNTKK